MKNLIKTFFFGYLPLGLKRLFRVITFSFVVLVVLNYDGGEIREDEFIFLTILVIGVSMILSYVISGFIKQKKL